MSISRLFSSYLFSSYWAVCCLAVVTLLGSTVFVCAEPLVAPDAAESESAPAAEIKIEKKSGSKKEQAAAITPEKIPGFVERGVAWLAAAQHKDGGWGGGSHANQALRDPHAVTTDPATTAFTLLSLMRSGHTPLAGTYQKQTRSGLEYLLNTVEKAKAEGPLITEIQGTQPQTKLGRLVDTSMTAQYLARVLPLLSTEDSLHARVDKALDKCLKKLEVSQEEDGSWGKGSGWAPVLQSSLSCSALEVAAANGKQVSQPALARARQYQKGNYDVKSGAVKTEAAAGVKLYAFGGAMRGNAVDALQAESLVKKAKDKGQLAANAPVNEESLRIAGVQDASEGKQLAQAFDRNEQQIKQLGDETLLQGFGNNGGEEFLSYLMTSESLVIAGTKKFREWNTKMTIRLEKVQNADGSWNGHHCITSPVFCTAAVVQCLTTENDAEFLTKMAKQTSNEALATVDK